MRRIDAQCFQQRTRRTFDLATPLLPIPNGSNGNVDQLGEVALRKPGLLTNRLHAQTIDMKFARRSALATDDLVHLRHALYELAKEFLIHRCLENIAPRRVAFVDRLDR